MKPTLISTAIRFASHALFALSILGASYTFKTYYVTPSILVGVVGSLAPSHAQRTADVIEANLSPSANITQVRALVNAEQQHALLLHETLVNNVRTQESLLLNELILWLVTLGVSLIVLLITHRKQSAL